MIVEDPESGNERLEEQYTGTGNGSSSPPHYFASVSLTHRMHLKSVVNVVFLQEIESRSESNTN
jgi:hypothetical protein